jgi:hypothetical protein
LDLGVLHSKKVKGHGTVWFGDHSHSDFAAVFDRQDDVDAPDSADFLDTLTGAGAKLFATHPHLQGAPERQSQKADQYVGFDPVSFLMKDGMQPEITLADAECSLGLLELLAQHCGFLLPARLRPAKNILFDANLALPNGRW